MVKLRCPGQSGLRRYRDAVLTMTLLLALSAASAARAQDVAVAIEGVESSSEKTATAAPDSTSLQEDTGEVVEEELLEEPVSDPAAQAYLMKCAGCHTIGGGVVSGPDLKRVSAWSPDVLGDAIRRMEKNVGPMTEGDVAGFTAFLLGEDAAERLAEEQKRISLQHAASLDPASAEIGATLFFGKRPMKRGGVACAACHQAGGRGGNLAVSLEDAFTRIGETPLIATCESPGYPIMRSIYADRGLTTQEAVHVVKFLEAVSKEPLKASTMPMHLIGILGAAGILYAISRRYQQRLQGTRAKMVAQAHRRFNKGNSAGRKG